MSESVLKKFGKYFLLDRIGEGGMAEIFRARMATPDSQGRFIVIKRIQGAYSNNQEFVQMFQAEVQVTMRFSHPNIVQLYESGEEGGQHYIAMELVEGRNLRQVLSKISQRQERIPIPASCFIIEQSAAGLNYAHNFKDRITGEPLNLVHRDVSPQNILVSYDGNIKVIDFGIAKAATNGEATRAGVIKGKLSYLSPEQVMGEVLDGRSDIFALGIVLWELLTGKRLFVADGDNEFQVLKMIESCNTFVKPPSHYNPEIPKELDAIVMQALARDTKKRFQNGEEMGRALRKLLAVQYSDFGPSDLSIFVKKLFHDLIVEDRKQLQQLNGRADELIALGVQVPKSPEPAAGSVPVAAPKEQPREATRVTNLGDKFDKSQIVAADRVELAVTPQRQVKVPANKTQTGIHGSSPISGPARSRTNTGIRRPVPVQQVESGGVGGFFKLLGGVAMLAVAGFLAYQQFGPIEERHPASLPTDQQQLPVKVQTTNNAQLKIRMFPDGDFSKTKVTVNSQPFDLNKGVHSVPVDELLEVVVDRPGFVTYRREFTIKTSDIDATRDYSIDVKLDPMVYGTFTLSTQPEIADVTIINLDQGSSGNAQRPVVLKTPVYQEKLPVGHYKVVVKNDVLNLEKVFQIEIKEGDRLVKNGVPLEPIRAPAGRR
jgi:serine/threonine-protein kinase